VWVQKQKAASVLERLFHLTRRNQAQNRDLPSKNPGFWRALFLSHCLPGICGDLATNGVLLGGFLCETWSGLVQ
jgi:hypothetical protein